MLQNKSLTSFDYKNNVNQSRWARTFGDKSFWKEFWRLLWPQLLVQGISLFLLYAPTLFFPIFWKDGAEAIAGKSAMITMKNWTAFQSTIAGAAAGANLLIAQYYGVQNINGIRNGVIAKFGVNGVIAIPMFFSFFFCANSIATFSTNLTSGLTYDLTCLAIKWVSIFFLFNIIQYAFFGSLLQIRESKKAMWINGTAFVFEIIFTILILTCSSTVQTAIILLALLPILTRVISITGTFIVVFAFKIEMLKFWKVSKLEPHFLASFWQPTLAYFAIFGTLAATNIWLQSTMLYFNPVYNDVTQTITVLFQIPGKLELALAPCVSYLISSYMGRNELKQAKQHANYILKFAFFISFVLTVIIFINAWWMNYFTSQGLSEELIITARNAQFVILPAFFLAFPGRMAVNITLTSGKMFATLAKIPPALLLTLQSVLFVKYDLYANMNPYEFVAVQQDLGWFVNCIFAFSFYKFYHWEHKLI